MAPKPLIDRYLTLLPFASDDSKVAQSAEDSSAYRQLLLRESMNLTMEHPIFGVGPGVFDVAFSKVAAEAGRPGQFMVSHNTYTQVSAECGLIGFFSYVASLVFAFRAVRWVRRRTHRVPGLEKLAAMSLCLQMALVAFTVLAFFASMAYVPFYVVFAALADILRRVAAPEIEAVRERSAMALARA